MDWPEVKKELRGIVHLFTPSLARILFEYARDLPDGATILEIGAYKGYSTCALAYGCLGTAKGVYTVDTFRGEHDNTDQQGAALFFDEFWWSVKVRGLDQIIQPVIARSAELYGTWARPLDLLFIDGGHTNEIVRGDLNAFFPYLKPGGWLFMHDVYPEQPKPVNVNPTWLGVPLNLLDCQYSLNLAWGRKPGPLQSEDHS